jgi:hypothetical protein
VPLVEQELLTLPEHLISPLVQSLKHLTTFLLYAISRKTVPSGHFEKEKNLGGQLFIF